jgi:hypothetical protein
MHSGGEIAVCDSFQPVVFSVNEERMARIIDRVPFQDFGDSKTAIDWRGAEGTWRVCVSTGQFWRWTQQKREVLHLRQVEDRMETRLG